ncbi:MAG: FAD-dependent oxidoreductase, partial [Marmoricola sp.]
GIVGAWAAYELARAGCSVEVLDADLGERSASFGNAGILAQSYAKPMSNPRNLLAGMRSVLGSGHDVEVVRPLGFATLRWLLRFGVDSRPFRASAAAEDVSRMTRRSIELYEELASREGMDLGLRRTGWLYVAHTPSALRQQQALALEMARIGIRSEMLSADGVHNLEPSLDPALVGGVLYTDDSSMDPGRIVTTVREAARRHGANFVEGCVEAADLERGRVRGLLTASGETVTADQFVLAGGAGCAALGRMVGVRIPVERGTGWSLTVPTPEPLAGRALMGIEDHVVINPDARSIRITGGMRFGGEIGQLPPPGHLAALRASAERILPALGDVQEPGEGWMGARPMTTTGLPIVRRVNPTTIVVTGHGTLGMTLAPESGVQVRRLILGACSSEQEALP